MYRSLHCLVRLIFCTIARQLIDTICILFCCNACCVLVKDLVNEFARNRQTHAIRHVIKSCIRITICFNTVELQPFACNILDSFYKTFVDVWREIVIPRINRLSAFGYLTPIDYISISVVQSGDASFVEQRINSYSTLLASFQLTDDKSEPLCGWYAFDSLLTCPI